MNKLLIKGSYANTSILEKENTSLSVHTYKRRKPYRLTPCKCLYTKKRIKTEPKHQFLHVKIN